MTACVNCAVRPAVYRVADPGADAVTYCHVDLPLHLQARAATGELNLDEPVPTALWVKRAKRVFIEVVRSPDGHLLDAAEERPGHLHAPNRYLLEQPLDDDEPVLELPVGQKPTPTGWHESVPHTH